MDSRGLYYVIKLFVLIVLLSQCCPNIARSTISPTFNGLECNCDTNCTYGVQDCQLVRCVCPYDPGNYAAGVNCTSDLCPQNCCTLIPPGLRNHSATHYMYSEKYQSLGSSKSVRTSHIFTKLNGSTTARWVKTVVQHVPSLTYIYAAEATLVHTIADKLANGTTDFLDNEAEAPDKVFGVDLQSIEGPKGFSESLSCQQGLHTICNSNFCSCLILSENGSSPVGNPLKNITGGKIVFDIGNNDTTVSTSSSLTPYHSIDVTRRPSESVAGWAPFFNDSSPWVEFSDIQANVCGVVIQGVDWSTSRRLDKFEIKADDEVVNSLEGENHFLSGVVLDSKSFHLFSEPKTNPTSLRINVLKPNNRLHVGFRASLITCGDATNSFEDNCNESPLVERAREEVEKVLKETSQDSNLANAGEDQVDLVGKLYDALKTFLDENSEKHEFPEGKRFTIADNNTEIDVYFVDLNDLNETGYTFTSSETNSTSDNSHASVYIPADGFVTDEDANTEVVIVTSVVEASETEPSVETKPSVDELGYQYEVASPILTVSVFVNGTGFEHKQIIEKIDVKLPYKNTTTNPRILYFQEANIKKTDGFKTQLAWSSHGCNSTCHELICEMTCNHATSFAVLQLLGESKLSEQASLVSSILTTIGCVVSIISLIAALVIYFLVRSSIASAQYAIHSNLMISLLIALCIFMTLLAKEKSKAICDTMKFLLQYFFTAAFCWMLCEGIHLYRQIITVFNTGSKYLWVYFLIGWVVPLIFVVISIAVGTMQKTEKALHTTSTCFFSYKDGSIWYFVAPVLLVILINIGILLRVILVVIRSAKLQAEKDSSETAYQAKAGLRSALLLIPLLGCSYIIGFLVSFHGVFEFMYNIINSLQGFFIAMFYCVMNKEIRTAIVKYIQRSRDMSTIQASTTGTALPKTWPESMSSKITSSRNQVAPEPIKRVHVEDVD